MVLAVYRQMPAGAVAVSKRKRQPGRGRVRAKLAFEQSRSLLHRRSAGGPDEREPGVARAPSARLAAADDGLVAP